MQTTIASSESVTIEAVALLAWSTGPGGAGKQRIVTRKAGRW